MDKWTVQKNACIATTTVRRRQPKEWVHVRPTFYLRSQLPAQLYHQCLSIFLTLTRHPPVPVTVDSPTVLLIDTLTTRAPEDLRVRLLVQRTSLSLKASGSLRKNEGRYTQYIGRKVRTMAQYSIRQLVYVNHTSLKTLATDSDAAKYNKVPP